MTRANTDNLAGVFPTGFEAALRFCNEKHGIAQESPG